MYGANYPGQPQYGQGPGFYIPPVLHTLSATVTCTASISASEITNLILSSTITCTASIARQFGYVISAVSTCTASFATDTASTLKLIAATTKFLNGQRYTVTATIVDADAYFQADYFQNDYFQIGSFAVVTGTATITKNITPERTTNKIDD